MTIKEIRALTGLTQKQFCEKYGIPRRTIEAWEMGVRTPPPYLLELLKMAVREEIEETGMRRIRPSDDLCGVPCSIVAVSCALGKRAKGRPTLGESGYATLASMNKYVRANLPILRQVKYKRGERPKLKDLHLDGRAIVCVLGHYLYLDHETYWSFLKNSSDDVVSVWVLE